MAASLPLVLAGDQAQTVVNGPIIVIVGGTYTGGQPIFFEATPDGGTTWVPTLGTPMDAVRAPENSNLLVANFAGQWFFNFQLGSFTNFRVRAGGAMGGTLNVWIFPAPATFSPFVNTTTQPAPTPTLPVTADAVWNGASFDLAREDLGVPGSSLCSVPEDKRLLELIALQLTRIMVGIADICNRDLKTEVTADEVADDLAI